MKSGFILIHVLVMLSIAQLCLLAMFDDVVVLKNTYFLERDWQRCAWLMRNTQQVAQRWQPSTSTASPLAVLDSARPLHRSMAQHATMRGYLKHFEEPLPCVNGVCYWRDTLICFNGKAQRVRWRQKITRKAMPPLLD